MSSPGVRQSLAQAVTDQIANELSERTILPQGYYLDQPRLARFGLFGEQVTFDAIANEHHTSRKVRITVEVL